MFTDVLVALVRSSSFVLIKLFWKEVLFLIVLLKVGPSLSLRLLILMTLEGLFDHLMHFVHGHCAIAIANFLPLLFVEAFTGTLCNAFTPHRDASPLGR